MSARRGDPQYRDPTRIWTPKWVAVTSIPSSSQDSDELRREAGYGSFMLLQLLNLLTSRRLLIVGASGRAKTSVAMLTARLAGSTPEEVRRSVQPGHPPLTLTVFLGRPQACVLVEAREPADVRLADFHNAQAVRAFLAFDPGRLEPVDRACRAQLAACDEGEGPPVSPVGK